MTRFRQRFWCAVVDVTYLVAGFGSRSYLWALKRAAKALWETER